MATKGTVPGSKDANYCEYPETIAKHANTVGKPMRPYHPDSGTSDEDTRRLQGNFPPPINTSRTDNDQPAANTFDPRTEIQSVPAPATTGPDSRSGMPDVVSAERGTGHRP